MCLCKVATGTVTKEQAYPSTIRHFRRLKGQGGEVFQQTYIMSGHGKVDMIWWEEQLAWWGITGTGPALHKTVTLVGYVTAWVRGNH